MDQTTIKLVITDDDQLVSELLKDFLSRYSDLEVLYTAENGVRLIEMLDVSENIPDIILLDLKMEGKSGVELTEYLKIHFPAIKIVILTSFYKDSFTGFMLKTGAAAFLPKGLSPEALVTIIRQVKTEGFYLSELQLEQVRSQLAGNLQRPELDDNRQLTDRELEVIRLICEQKTAKEIGELLFITQRTVEGHKNNIFSKTGAKNLAGLVIYALQNGIITPDNLPLIS